MRFAVRLGRLGSVLGVLIGVASGLDVAARPARAQAEQYVGQWRCQLVNQTVSNNRFENYSYTFTLALYGNGSFEAQGVYYAETNGYNDPFQAQGQWQVEQGGIVGRGQAFKQSGNTPFNLVLTGYTAQSMSFRTESAYGRLAMACQR